MWRNKTIFEEDFRRSTDPTYAILKMVKDIDNYSTILGKLTNATLFLLAGKELRRGELSLIVMEHTRIHWSSWLWWSNPELRWYMA